MHGPPNTANYNTIYNLKRPKMEWMKQNKYHEQDNELGCGNTLFLKTNVNENTNELSPGNSKNTGTARRIV